MAPLTLIGRCAVREGPLCFLGDPTPVPDDTWTQCPHSGRQDHEGSFLCPEHMQHWYCEDCVVQLERWGPYLSCATCAKHHRAACRDNEHTGASAGSGTATLPVRRSGMFVTCLRFFYGNCNNLVCPVPYTCRA
jgi:hypothetical protein